ncbi:unnamed protein product [Rhizoctonia solani]|uniref:RGS domain-containing protein n=1 Tax=Rhizoctonia solani TaxID=456999 RepID=A0A8H2WHA3_9AGAM|nr:unnamed protein product [Rhizoctonia solani]
MLSPSKRRQQRRPQAERPPAHWFTIGSLRSFGKRLWNPPPPSKEERYVWLVKPKYTMQLEDVVADKHLPPLSRNDFEEYLLYVEGSLGNLYFYEWVHRYRQLFAHWAESVFPSAGVGLPSSSKGAYKPRELWERLKNCQDRGLKQEFAFAKDVFFRPGAPWRLDISSEDANHILLIPNIPPPYGEQEHTIKMPSFPNQPEPSIFDPILRHIRDALDASFACFIRLAFCNAGLWHCVPGMASYRRGYVVGSLPLIWVGLWFALVTLSGHCLTVYVTGDARQLYPWEIERPLPPDVVPPPVYSLAAAPGPTDVESGSCLRRRYRLNASGFLSLTGTSLLSPQGTCDQSLAERKWREGVSRMLKKPWCDDKPTDFQAPEQKTAADLPPARHTKGLPRSSLVMGIEQAKVLEACSPSTILSPSGSASDFSQRRNAVVDLSVELKAMGLGPEGRPDSPFSEENDFGIVVSDVFEGDDVPEMHHFSSTVWPFSTSAVDHDGQILAQQSFGSSWLPPSSWQDAPTLPIQPPEYAIQRRRAIPDIFGTSPCIRHEGDAFAIDLATVETRRGSRSSEVEQGPELYYPWARTLYGPMTPVYSPLVRRAHWATTWRTAAIATVVTFGLTLGLIR